MRTQTQSVPPAVGPLDAIPPAFVQMVNETPNRVSGTLSSIVSKNSEQPSHGLPSFVATTDPRHTFNEGK